MANKIDEGPTKGIIRIFFDEPAPPSQPPDRQYRDNPLPTLFPRPIHLRAVAINHFSWPVAYLYPKHQFAMYQYLSIDRPFLETAEPTVRFNYKCFSLPIMVHTSVGITLSMLLSPRVVGIKYKIPFILIIYPSKVQKQRFIQFKYLKQLLLAM
jgi:hypothetical protein